MTNPLCPSPGHMSCVPRWCPCSCCSPSSRVPALSSAPTRCSSTPSSNTYAWPCLRTGSPLCLMSSSSRLPSSSPCCRTSRSTSRCRLRYSVVQPTDIFLILFYFFLLCLPLFSYNTVQSSNISTNDLLSLSHRCSSGKYSLQSWRRHPAPLNTNGWWSRLSPGSVQVTTLPSHPSPPPSSLHTRYPRSPPFTHIDPPIHPTPTSPHVTLVSLLFCAPFTFPFSSVMRSAPSVNVRGCIFLFIPLNAM